MNLASLDLNLLVTLHALLELRNVTRAGERVCLSQPATSAALAKLRRHFDDELLVRVGREFQLTPLAQVLLPLVTEAMLGAERAFEVRPAFDALDSERHFVVALSDYAASIINEPLRNILTDEAPHVSVEFAPLPPQLSTDELLRRDVVIVPVGYGLQGPHDVLFRDRYVAILDVDNADRAQTHDTYELLRRLPHVVGRFGENVATPGDRLLEELEINRHVAASVTGLLALPLLVVGTDLVALVPWRLAQLFAPLGRTAILEIPGSDRVPLIEAAHWHPTRTEDPAIQWLRTTLLRASDVMNAP